MSETAQPMQNRPHRDDCPKPGMRYGAMIQTNKATIEAGQNGKVVMLCRNSKCPGLMVV